MKSICIISNRYPNVLTPTRQVFVQKLVWAMADLGVECTVICPIPINQYFNFYKLPVESVETTPNGSTIKLYFPRYVSAGQRKVLWFNTANLTTSMFTSAVKRVFKKLVIKPETVYGHFFSPAGICAARIGRMFGIPAFAAYGESTPWSILNIGVSRIKKDLCTLAGVVSVSSANKRTLIELDVIPCEKISVFPNGFQEEIFYPRNKVDARNKFGFDRDAFIVSFVGQFNERKGVMRLAAAANGLKDVKVAFAGKGDLVPENENCIFKKAIAPTDIPDFLSASDIFVLPTLNEGCSNAIVEAMACGLPVVSSDLDFNRDILDNGNAMLIDPKNIEEIRSAIEILKNDSALLEQKRQKTLERIKSLTVRNRAEQIRNWIVERTLIK